MASIGGIQFQAPTARTSFSNVLPYERVFNKNLMTALAESQINPEIDRARTGAMGNLNRNLAQTGGFRMGTGQAAQKDLTNQYERQRKEQVTGFLDSLNNNLTDYYNKQSEMYYKSPSAYTAPTLPTFDEYIKQNPGLAQAYQRITGSNPMTPAPVGGMQNPYMGLSNTNQF